MTIDVTFHPDAPPEQAHAPASTRTWLGLAVLALPTALLGLDVTLLYLALPALAADLQPTSTQALWIMDAYGFMIAGFLITMGSLGDRIGRRKLLMIGAVAFAAASVLAAFSTSAGMLIFARAALGVAGATLMPSTLALISNMFNVPAQRALAIGVWATMFALGMAAGPLVGGVLLEQFWWGSAFLVALPIVAILLVAGPFLLPEYRDPAGGRLDLISAFLSLLAILPGIYALKEVAKYGIDFPSVLAFAASVVLAMVFVRRQLTLRHPLLDVRLFANRAFTVALIILLFGLVSVGGTMLLVTQYLQLVAGFSPLVAGAWMGPPALMMFVAGIAAPLMARKVRPGIVVGGALALSAIGYLMLTVIVPSSGIALLIAGFSLAYLGLGTIAALGTDLVVSTAPPTKAGAASAMSEMVQELGVALGVAILGSLTTFIYRREIFDALPSGLRGAESEAVTDSLAQAYAVQDTLPEGVFTQAQSAFVAGLNGAAMVATLIAASLALLSVVALRHARTQGG
ncbi:MFS transporter [Roseinatronobacter alkalisoli]|uniref:MFS transporter n=1 Tax=Roseinatronobacter alkalisoli TaxID=3028235 RepID=A0ABT5T719_9RHOB|nr:MFS transporter [Roseinatronobacter sp. HJB301]MDD7970839.1 MFS transporter [Roseinatronobacter sp. HJB301]